MTSENVGGEIGRYNFNVQAFADDYFFVLFRKFYIANQNILYIGYIVLWHILYLWFDDIILHACIN